MGLADVAKRHPGHERRCESCVGPPWKGENRRTALVACSHGCGKDLREIASIEKMGDYVLLASHHRVLPEASITECFQDERYLLQSEIAVRRNAAIRAQDYVTH